MTSHTCTPSNPEVDSYISSFKNILPGTPTSIFKTHLPSPTVGSITLKSIRGAEFRAPSAVLRDVTLPPGSTAKCPHCLGLANLQ